MTNPKVFERFTQERDRLERFATILTATSVRGFRYEVRDIYFDAGQDWMWTTIVAYDGCRTVCQCLSPREWEEVIYAEPKELLELAEEYYNGEYCQDRIK